MLLKGDSQSPCTPAGSAVMARGPTVEQRERGRSPCGRPCVVGWCVPRSQLWESQRGVSLFREQRC